MMHEMDGLSLIREIRGNVSYASIPILMLTAETGTELEKSALEEKVDYFYCAKFWCELNCILN